MTDDERRNLAVITDCCEAYNRHDVEGVLSYFAEDGEWLLSRGTPPEGGRVRGTEALRAMLKQRFRTIPDMAWEIHSHWIGGNRGCSEWTVTGTESNGNRINWLGMRRVGARRRGQDRQEGHLLEVRGRGAAGVGAGGPCGRRRRKVGASLGAAPATFQARATDTVSATLRARATRPVGGRALLTAFRPALYNCVSPLARPARGHRRRDGRVVEGGGLLNRCTVTSRTVGSNPTPSATSPSRQYP